MQFIKILILKLLFIKKERFRLIVFLYLQILDFWMFPLDLFEIIIHHYLHLFLIYPRRHFLDDDTEVSHAEIILQHVFIRGMLFLDKDEVYEPNQ